ncbi:hypothetical protein DAEQUDRAFT_676885 [Daedalea quercina L-15889]|uniref:YCII-related domain-containing protein n=1 Tax=Daedalea quercina L-15889 TaxID=1314783 RepID=A0A165M9B8_9APHY|nr:hypothetical protein DAEQUDRAFT_676885 [Daedalea quercina L-15889]
MTSTVGSKLHKFAVWAPDMTDPEAFSRRMSVRESHLANAKKIHANGTLIAKIGGGLLAQESIASPNAPLTLVGSMMVIEADSIESARKVIESDIYYQSGVWDKEKLQIFPWLQANL